MRNDVLCKGLLKLKTNTIAGSHLVQPPDIHAKRHTKKSGAPAILPIHDDGRPRVEAKEWSLSRWPLVDGKKRRKSSGAIVSAALASS